MKAFDSLASRFGLTLRAWAPASARRVPVSLVKADFDLRLPSILKPLLRRWDATFDYREHDASLSGQSLQSLLPRKNQTRRAIRNINDTSMQRKTLRTSP